MLDEVFGEIDFGRTFGIVGAGFWDGRAVFGPLKKDVKVRVVSGRKGPTDEQRRFFRELESHYDSLLDQIRPTLLYTPTRYWGSDFFGNHMPKLDWSDFELDSIGIDSSGNAAQKWNLSYRYVPMNDTYSVNFEGWDITHSELDD